MRTTCLFPSELRWWRKDSLATRLIRLRSWALRALFLATAKPRRAPPSDTSQANKVQYRSLSRRLRRNTTPKAAPSSKRASRGNLKSSGSCRESPSCAPTGSGAETRPALATTCGKHSAPATSGFACTEAVGASSLDLARLIGSFHGTSRLSWRSATVCQGTRKCTTTEDLGQYILSSTTALGACLLTTTGVPRPALQLAQLPEKKRTCQTTPRGLCDYY